MAFALHRAHHGIPSCVVLITGDGDYAYTLNKIRDLKVKTIVIHGSTTTTAAVLFYSCDQALSFQHHVLGEDEDEDEDEDEEDDGSEVGCGQRPAHPSTKSASWTSDQEVQDALNDALDGCHVLLCHCLQELHSLAESLTSSWVQDAKLAKVYYKKRGFGSAQEAREGGEGVEKLSPYSKTRDSAVVGGFIQMGRKELLTGKVVESSGRWDRKSKGSELSTNLFVRLTDTGRMQLEDNAEAAREAMDAIQGEPSFPFVDSAAPDEELRMDELRMDEAEAVAAPSLAYEEPSLLIPAPSLVYPAVQAVLSEATNVDALPQWQAQLGQPGTSAVGEGGGGDRGASGSGAAVGGGGGDGADAGSTPGAQRSMRKNRLLPHFK